MGCLSAKYETLAETSVRELAEDRGGSLLVLEDHERPLKGEGRLTGSGGAVQQPRTAPREVISQLYMAVGQNPVPLVNIKIGGPK